MSLGKILKLRFPLACDHVTDKHVQVDECVHSIKWFEWSVRRDKFLMNSNLLLQMPQIVIFWQFWSPVSKLLSALAPHFKEYYNKMIVKVHCEHTLTTLASSGSQY